MDAVILVDNTAKAALDEDKCCTGITFDVKNAFNSAIWSKILESLFNLGLPKHLVRIIVDFPIDRVQCCESDMMNSTRVVLGSLLWIIMYNGVLMLDLPTGVPSISFLGDTATKYRWSKAEPSTPYFEGGQFDPTVWSPSMSRCTEK